MWISVNFHMQVSAPNCHSKFEFHRVMTECCSKIEVYDWVLFQNWGLWLSAVPKLRFMTWVLFQNWGLWLSGCSKIEVYDWVAVPKLRFMTEWLLNAQKAIKTLASGTMKVYGLPQGQGLDHRNDMTLACSLGHIIPAVQALARGQSINIHSTQSLGYYYLNRLQSRNITILNSYFHFNFTVFRYILTFTR